MWCCLYAGQAPASHGDLPARAAQYDRRVPCTHAHTHADTCNGLACSCAGRTHVSGRATSWAAARRLPMHPPSTAVPARHTHACSVSVAGVASLVAYHIISYHIISYHIISYHIISYHIISYHIISYHSLACRALRLWRLRRRWRWRQRRARPAALLGRAEPGGARQADQGAAEEVLPEGEALRQGRMARGRMAGMAQGWLRMAVAASEASIGTRSFAMNHNCNS